MGAIEEMKWEAARRNGENRERRGESLAAFAINRAGENKIAGMRKRIERHEDSGDISEITGMSSAYRGGQCLRL